MKLRKPVPPGRTEAGLRRHWEVERALAARLLAADRPERVHLYRTLYQELFSAVPDHPQLHDESEPTQLAAKNRQKLSMLEPFLGPDTVVAEFGPGDGSFAAFIAASVARVYAIDISDQRPSSAPMPANLELVVYDGYDLPLPAVLVDVVFSDQFLEHLHPDDMLEHLRLAHGLLRPGGRYVLRTPHRFFGPHDISAYFSTEPQGFHLKEWTYGEMANVLRAAGYRDLLGGRKRHHRYRTAPLGPLLAAERLFGRLPHGLRARLARPFLQRNLYMVATA